MRISKPILNRIRLQHFGVLFFCVFYLFFSNIYAQSTEGQHKFNSYQLEELEEMLNEAVAIKSKNADSSLAILSYISRQSLGLKPDIRFDFQARILNEFGNTYRLKGDYIEAINYYESGIQFSTIHNLHLRKAKLLNALGGLYQEIEDLNKALYYCKSSLKIYELKFLHLRRDLSMLYANVGNILIIMDKNQEAQRYLIKAREINEELNDDYLASLIYSGLGLVRMRLEDYEGALKNFEIGKDAAVRIQTVDSKLAILANISSTYIKMKRYTDAEELLKISYQESLEINHRYLIKEILNLFVELYAETKQFEKAYQFQKEYSDLKSELFSQELNQRIASIDEKLKNTERQKKILELNQLNENKNFEIRRNRYLLFLVSILSAFTMALIWSYYQRLKVKNAAKIFQMENQMFRLQMKPHFIFNVLSSIGGFMNQNKTKEAGIYLAKFARLIRNVLEQSNQELIPLNKEIELLKYYLELQQLRFPNKFNFHFDTDEIAELESIYIPPMLLQPLVENAIEHGFVSTEKQGNLWLNFIQNDDHIQIEIIDDGVGINHRNKERNLADLAHLKNDSISSKLIVDHLKYYQMKFKKDFKVTFDDNSTIDSAIEKGTRVVLILPLMHKIK